MDIEDASDLVYYTYFMLDWTKVRQAPSETTCVSCGGPMLEVGPVTDRRGRTCDGRVCHHCKTVLWIRR